MAKYRLQAPSGYVFETDSASVANDLQVDKGYKRLDLPERKARKSVKRAAPPAQSEVARAENEGLPTNFDSFKADETK